MHSSYADFALRWSEPIDTFPQSLYSGSSISPFQRPLTPATPTVSSSVSWLAVSVSQSVRSERGQYSWEWNDDGERRLAHAKHQSF